MLAGPSEADAMGLNNAMALKLMDAYGRGDLRGGSALTLGALRMRGVGANRARLRRSSQAAGLSGDLTPFTKPRPEGFLNQLGYDRFHELDVSGYEGADILADLNQPLPERLHNQFDLIVDGGTLEHVFNVPVAFANVLSILKVSGVFSSTNTFSGEPCHGLYQFNSDLVWSFWKRTCNCEVLSCTLLPADPTKKAYEMTDLTGNRRRPSFRQTDFNGLYFLYYEIRKTAESECRAVSYQSDYEVFWGESAAKSRANIADNKSSKTESGSHDSI